MGWITILLIWFLAPFVQFGVIIWLLMANGKYKRRIHELEQDRFQQPPYKDRPEFKQAEPTCCFLSGEWQSAGCPQPEEEVKTSMQPMPQTTLPINTPLETASLSAAESGQNKSFTPALRTLALILGVIFIALAGLIFATTTWQILSDAGKTLLVFACAISFFGASFMAEKIFHVSKTGNAFYILGSIFLFFSLLAAAYFRLLGAEFILDGEKRWNVLWAGSVVTLGAFWAGLRWFRDRIYTQTCLWGISVSLFFMAKALCVGWNGFVCIMTVYSAALIFIKEYGKAGRKKTDMDSLKGLVAENFRFFAQAHFGTFAAISLIRGLFPVWRMAAEGCAGVHDDFLDRFSLLSFTGFGMIAVTAATAGIWVMAKEGEGGEHTYGNLKVWAGAETVLYAAGSLMKDFICRMAAVDLAFFVTALILHRRHRENTSLEIHGLFLDCCGSLAMVFTAISFYLGGSGRTDGLVLCLMAFSGYYIWFYLGKRQWPHLLASIILFPLPFMARVRLDLTLDQMEFGTAALFLVSVIGVRRFFPIVKRDDRVQGGWRVDWHHAGAIWTILLMAASGNDLWRFVYVLLAALYFGQYTEITALKKTSLTLSAGCISAAFWLQPFFHWPHMAQLEMRLLPVVFFLWTLGHIWKHTSWITILQNAGYGACLALLCMDAVFTGLIFDALLVEGICLVLFTWAQVKDCLWWTRISAGVLLGIALFMTRGFWLSIAWWVYLLTAGVGLLIFAGVMEKKDKDHIKK